MKKKESKFVITLIECQRYLPILTKIFQILNNSNLIGQKEVIKKLIDYIIKEDTIQFVKFINSIDMWGGSGAVWEVYIENEIEAREFENELINIINLMEETNILGKGIKSIRRIFKNK